MKEILEKYFRDEKIKYFHQSDKHKQIEGDTYLRYSFGSGGYIELWFGGNNGEVCLTCTNDPEKIETLIKLLIL